MSSPDRLTESEIESVVSNLGKLEPGALPFEIFHAVTRLVATPIIEMVPLRRDADEAVEVLLLRREADDPVWPNQLHVPGTVVRSSDREGSFDDAFLRIAIEIGSSALGSVELVRNIIHQSGRGMEVSQVYITDMPETPPVNGQFYLTDSLPQDIVESQLDFIPDAVRFYEDRF